MRVRTQAEVCKAFGKRSDDRKFVSRQIAKWEVKKINWGYEFESVENSVAKEEKMPQCEQYGDEFNKLKEENERLKEENRKLFLESLWSWEYEELKVNYEYLQQKFRRLKRGYELVIQLTYKYAAKNMKITKEEYKEQLSEEVNEILNEEMWRLD